MKIGFLLLDMLKGKGGQEKVLIDITNGLKKHSIESHLYFMHQPTDESFLNHFNHYQIAQLPKILQKRNKFIPKFLHNVICNIFRKKESKKMFEQIKNDQLDALFILNLSKRLIRYSADLKRLKDENGIALISWPHTSLTAIPTSLSEKLKKHLHLFDAHFAISDGVKREFQQLYQQNNVIAIYNPVMPADIMKRDPNKFIYIGRIDESKRLYELINILIRLRGGWHLDVIGSTGDEKKDQQFKEYLSSNRLSNNIKFHGWQEDPWEIITETGTLLLHSKLEGFSLVLVEAMMRGIPCVAADCPTGPADIIQPNINGWLYEMNDEVECLNILQSIIDGDLSLPKPHQIQKSVEKFSTDIVVANFSKKLESMINKKY